jgi:hypothetical protein
MHKTAAYLYFGYKPLHCHLNFSCLVNCGDFLVVDVVIPTLTAYIHVLMPVLGMPLNLLKDVIIRLRDIGSPRLFLLLASFGLLLSLANLSISILSLLSGLDNTTRVFPRAAASGRTPSCVLGVAADYSGVSCLGSGTHLSSVDACSAPGASGGTCLEVLCLAAVSTVVGFIGSAFGATCSLVALVAADDSLPQATSYSGISVDDELQFDKSIVNYAYYYLHLLLMITEVYIYLHVRLAMCG